MASGVFWSAVQKYSGLIVQLVVTAILARLLSPEDFGVIAIATVIIAFFVLLTDMGIGPAIIQRKDLTKDDLNSLFSFGIYGGIVLSLLFLGLSYPIAAFYKEVSLVPVCQILSINLLFSAWNIVPNALMMKNKLFKLVAMRTLALQVICGIASVVVAYNNGGLYTLLIAPVVTAFCMFFLNYHQFPLQFTLKVHTASLKKIMAFSTFQFLFNFINYFSRNLDKLIIGRYYAMNDLGYYEKSYRLMMLPMSYVTNVISPVMHPILSSLQNDYEELADKYNKIIRILLIISFPIGVFLYFAADDVILIIYGNKWTDAIPVFQILALSLPLQMILSTTGAIYQAAGKTNWLFYGGVSNTTCTVVGFVLATICFRTIEAMAWAWDITLILNTFISYFILYRIVLKTGYTAFLREFIKPGVMAVVLTATLAALQALNIEVSNLFHLLMKATLSLLITLAFVQLSGMFDLRKPFQQLLNRIGSYKKGRR